MTIAPQIWPDAKGRFGPYGGRYVPETLVAPLEELEYAYELARKALDPDGRLLNPYLRRLLHDV